MQSLHRVVAVVAIVGLVSRAQAQTPRPFRLAVSGGATLLAGEDRDFFRDGFNLAGSVRVNVPAAQIGLRFEAAYHGVGGRNKSDQTVPGGPDTLLLGDFSVLSATVAAAYDLVPPSPARPYLLVGGGLFRTEAHAVKYGQPVRGTATDFGVTAGVGVNFHLGTLSAFAEARVHNIFGDGGSARLYPVAVGVVF